MQEKLTALFRKLELNGKTYYQCDFVVPEFIPNERFDNLQNRLSSSKEKFFITGTEEQLNKLGVKPNTIFYENKGLHIVNDKEEVTYVRSKFSEVLEKNKEEVSNQPEDLINSYVDKIFNETKCHKGPIKNIIQTIVFNRDINNSVIPQRDKYLNHDNIVIYGPMGAGKSMILESLKRILQIPTFDVELTDNLEINRQLIVEAILNSKKEFNGHAVAIVDLDFNKFGQLFAGDAFYPLKELANSSNVIYSPYLKKPVNLREITFIMNVNIPEAMLAIEDLDNYFIRASGCSKAIFVDKPSMIQTKKILTDSIYSKIKFCENEAKKYNREFSVNKKTLALMVKYSELFSGNIMMIEAAIMESFKLQLNSGYKKIVIGDETFAILKGIIEVENKGNWVEEAPNNEIKEVEENKENEEANSLKHKEELINYITNKIKETIKGQDRQVRNVVKAIIDNQDYANNPNIANPEKRKSNILIRGASGTGKTEIIRQASKILGIPMIVEDATRYTEEGYVGESVTDMLLNIYRETKEDIKQAERGIIVIDEIDKKANTGQRSDVARGAVLDSMLKMVEGEKYQLEYKKALPTGNVVQVIPFDTRRLTFICLGAFDGLDKMRDKRVKTAQKPKSMGFQSGEQQEKIKKELEGINTGFINADYVEFGFTEQFVNRFDKKVYLNNLTRDDLLCIMKDSMESPLKILQEDYANYGIEILYTDDFYEKLADVAITKKSGARSIKEVFEDLKSFIGFDELELSNYSKVVFNAKCFDDPNALELIEKGKTYKK